MKSFFSKHKTMFIVAIMMSCFATTFAQTYEYSTPFVEENGLSYDISTGNARLWHSESNLSQNVIIPASLENSNTVYNVTELRKETFNNCTDIKSITIPASVQVIYPKAIYNCPNLETIVLPEHFRSQDIKTIAGKCPKLKNIIYSNTSLSLN